MFQKAILVTALSCILSNFGPIDDWTHLGAAFSGIAYGFVICPTLQVDDTSSRTGREEQIRLVGRFADPCKSLLEPKGSVEPLELWACYDGLTLVMYKGHSEVVVDSDGSTVAHIQCLHSKKGSGEDGQLGIGNNEEREWVCVVQALEPHNVRSVVAGSRNSLAICDDGKLFTWGWNQRGTLGHPPETKTENIPSQVKALANVKIVQRVKCVFNECNHVKCVCTGGNEYGQCGEEPERKDDTGRPLRRDIVIPQRCAPKLVVRQVAAGGTHSVVLTREGYVWTWGQPWPPGDIKQISVPVRVQGLENVRLITVGAFHNLALQEDGTLWAWGNNEYGQLGTGDTQPRSQPIPVQGLSGLTLVCITLLSSLLSSYLSSCWQIVFRRLSSIDGWNGWKYRSQGFDEGVSTNNQIKLIIVTVLAFVSSFVLHFKVLLFSAPKVDIAAGGWHSTALTDDGEVYGWGRGEHGRLGFGDNDKSSKMVPQRVQLLAGEDIVQVSCGGTHSVALTRDGRMFSFGRGDHGRLGYGRKATTGQPMEVPINLPAPKSVSGSGAEGYWISKLVACGGRHTLAIVEWKTDESKP
ncbi:hypothetical protein Goklo_020504 [Gossypium klotzschianum]|nr:hypothetical protein [Gossypium klotzschianum]